MSKRTTLRPNQKPNSTHYKVWDHVKNADHPLTLPEIEDGLPWCKTGTISGALTNHSQRGSITKIPGRPSRYMVTPEQVEYMLGNTVAPATDILLLLEEPKVVAPQLAAEPPTPAEVNLAIREVLLTARAPLDAGGLAEKTGIPIQYVRTELSYMATQEPHSAPYRGRIKGEGRVRTTYHYMKSQKAWDVWAARS